MCSLHADNIAWAGWVGRREWIIKVGGRTGERVEGQGRVGVNSQWGMREGLSTPMIVENTRGVRGERDSEESREWMDV